MKMLFFIFTALLPSISFGATFPSLTPSLDGSPETLAFENDVIDQLGLHRIENDTELSRFVKVKKLVPLPKGSRIRWHKDLKAKYAYVLPHVRSFLIGTAKRGHLVIISSAVRPKAYQEELRKRNTNAAPAEGPNASSHPTGSTVDLSYKGLTKEQTRGLARYLLERERRREVQVTRERFQACFHVMVLPKKR